MLIKIGLVALAIAALPGSPLARTSSEDRINQRQAKQKQSIESGVKKGDLTSREAERLRQGQERVQRMEDKARADGVITQKEARSISREQGELSRDINRERRDKERTPTGGEDPAASRINQRQADQAHRIDEGEKAGDFSSREAKKLRHDQERIQRMEDKARSDGVITQKEARKIDRAQDQEDKDISGERRDPKNAVSKTSPSTQTTSQQQQAPGTADRAQPSSSAIAKAIVGTSNQTNGSYQKITPSKELNSTERVTWGYDENLPEGQRLAPGSGRTRFAPIDTMTVNVNGRPETLSAYANVNSDGVKVAKNGPFQCTALVSDYLSKLGFINAPKTLPNGRNVADALGTGANKEFFDYSEKKLAPPKVGSILSMEAGVGGAPDNIGHVAVVKGIKELNKDTITVTLLEQNATVAGESGFAVNREAILRRQHDGSWTGTHQFGSFTYDIVNWVTPASLPQ